MNNPEVVSVCCYFVFVNYYPFWEGVEVSSAMSDLNSEDALLNIDPATPPKEAISRLRDRMAKLRLRCR